MIECSAGWCEKNGTIRADALGNAEALIGDGSGAVMIPVVKVGAGLAGYG